MDVVPPLDHKYVYGLLPPIAVIVAEPVLPPLHNMFIAVVEVDIPEEGWVIVTVFVFVQPFTSVTVTVFTPEVCPLITEVVCALDHK